MSGPLTAFQATILDKPGIQKTIKDIQDAIGPDRANPDMVQKRLERAWDLEYEERFNKAVHSAPISSAPEVSTDSKIDEILNIVRSVPQQ
ncbi:MAG: hypothetical protein ACK8QZ_10540, partial [Anaerolineales bacterium]